MWVNEAYWCEKSIEPPYRSLRTYSPIAAQHGCELLRASRSASLNDWMCPSLPSCGAVMGTSSYLGLTLGLICSFTCSQQYLP